MAEGLKAPVLKTGKRESASWVRIPPHPRSVTVHMKNIIEIPKISRIGLEQTILNAKAKKTRVAAEVILEDGESFYGCNMESSCHTLSICAERAAVVHAVIHRGPSIRIKTVWVLAMRLDAWHEINVCGSCLQLLSEFSTPDVLIQGRKLDDLYPVRYI